MLVRDARLPADVAVGDILATPVTGAYGHAMASNYNKVPRPAVVFVRDGVARLVVRRETDADLVRLDTDELSRSGASVSAAGTRWATVMQLRDTGDMAEVRVGILGCGNVGAALVRLLDDERRPDHAARRACASRSRASRCSNLAKERDVDARARACSPTTPKRSSPTRTSTWSSR